MTGGVDRRAFVIGVRPEKLEEYRRLHAAVWPEVLERIRDCNIRNYSIYYRDGLLFAYLEYVGSDWDADQARMAEHEPTRRWWQLTDPCQEPVPTAAPGERWASLEEVFHTP